MERLGDNLARSVLQNDYFKKLFIKIHNCYSLSIFDGTLKYELTDKEENDLVKFIDLLANSILPFARSKAYHLISLLEPFIKDKNIFKVISVSVYSKMGLFALNYDSDVLPEERRLESNFKKHIYTTDCGKYHFTDSQYSIYSEMENAPCYSFSGPTSLGKSFLIKRFVESEIIKAQSNLVIVVPSRALISQFRVELNNECGEQLKNNNYHVVANVSGNEDPDKKYIFILTPERLLNFHNSKVNLEIGFLFVDEAHKLSEDGEDAERSITEYNAIDLTIKKYPNIKLYFSSPNILNPEVFLSLFNKNIKYSKSIVESPVAQNLYVVDVESRAIKCFVDKDIFSIETSIMNEIQTVDDFIFTIGQKQHSNMIYCSSRDKSINNAYTFSKRIPKNKLTEPLIDAISKISSYIHQSYYLVECLKKGVAYHHGQLPLIVRNIIEELFRNGNIDFIFCTPTLIEGINMPTKNIFINCEDKIRLTKDKKRNANKTLTFWNLAGRAGRYRKELSGNIFCLPSASKKWDSSEIFKVKQIKLTTTIDIKLDSNTSLRKLEEALKYSEASEEALNKTIEYLANIICIDTLRFPNNFNDSFMLKKFISKHLLVILDLAKKRSEIIKDISFDVINSYKSLNFEIQRKIYNKIREAPLEYVLPEFSYDNCLIVLTRFNELYEWDKTEKIKLNQIKFFGFLMNDWISGKPINEMITKAIKYHEDNQSPVYFGHGKESPIFNGSKEHINRIIDNLLDNIERKLRYTFERYFNHYHKVLVSCLGEEKAGQNWAGFLEYGSKHSLVIAMQNLGVSRHTAQKIFKDKTLKSCLIIENKTKQLTGFNREKLLAKLDVNSIEYDEISMIA
ncbi:DEAD/DEAH box helicase family protein [Pseudoalteromonas sp. C2R02]|uniref:DEAD/DEAH box helicase n=1 Tax=Pseudoalteromonas sp. C2R02 TaxID=2841565 RepID=UPI001C093763|nr:DEAD/DEAH box helicase [Pseudoalteromonas sp. C2R02]MBU2968258.1 DEAD/DEAH box helicase family protein [Pseudoalteromonas sp. C2R02]